jgi:membrane-associated phospholipid phosphatase
MLQLSQLHVQRYVAAIACAVVLTCFFARNETMAQSGNRFVSWALDDGWSLTKKVAPLTPAIALTSGGLLVTGKQYDARFLDNVQQGYHGAWATYLDITNEIGGPRVSIPLLAVFGGTLLTKNQRLQDAAFTSFESWLYAGLITQGLKYLFGRYRPEEGLGSSTFRPFSGNSSFPSGHTAAAFALITPWVLYYPHPLTYGLFALSTGTAIARIAYDKHWPSDVIMGTIIGYTTGKWLVNRHKPNSDNSGVSFSSNYYGNGFSLGLTW